MAHDSFAPAMEIPTASPKDLAPEPKPVRGRANQRQWNLQHPPSGTAKYAILWLCSYTSPMQWAVLRWRVACSYRPRRCGVLRRCMVLPGAGSPLGGSVRSSQVNPTPYTLCPGPYTAPWTLDPE
eukprot:224237-Rhodomonas_salina.1